MSTLQKKIFGKTVKFEFDNSTPARILQKELQIYGDSDKRHDFLIIIKEKEEFEPVLLNPSNHKTLLNSFIVNIGYGDYTLRWNFTDRVAYVYYPKSNNKIKNIKAKFFNRMYCSNYELIGQIVHENILFIFPYMFDDTAPVHCSAIKYNNRVIAFGGTGGVGKTSTLLSLSSIKGLEFITDDILIINKNGMAYNNYAYPKIYAYNTADNRDLEKLLLKNENILGKMQWHYKKSKGTSRVLRRIPANLLYNVHPDIDPNKIDTYFFFSKGNYDEISVEKIDVGDMIILTKCVIENELRFINEHIRWHQMNSIIRGKNMFSLNEKWNNWSRIYENTFNDLNLYLIKVPLKIEHQQFSKEMKKILLESNNQ